MSARLRGTVGALACVMAAVVMVEGPAQAAALPTTEYFFSVGTYGTEVSGGDLPINSGRTVPAIVKCTSSFPVTRQNRAAQLNYGPAGVRVGAVTTESRSQTVPNGLASVSTATASDVSVGDPLTGQLRITGLRVRSIAAFVNDQPKPTTSGSIVSATFTVAGVPQNVTLDQLREGFVVPGGATVSFLVGSKKASPNAVLAQAIGLRVDLPATDTRINVARTIARMDKIPFNRSFGGFASIAETNLGDETVTSGPLVSKPHPCIGTGGVWKTESLARGALEDVISVKNAVVGVRSGHLPNNISDARSSAAVESASLLDGRIRLSGVRATAVVTRGADGRYARSSVGTTIARLTFDGEVIDLPPPGQPLVIEGIVKFTFAEVTPLRNGLVVTAAKLELLDGSENVVTVATASARIG